MCKPICCWIRLKGIENGPDTDDEKFAKAKVIAKTRGEALDHIMGEEKHQKFTQYLYEKLQKAQG